VTIKYSFVKVTWQQASKHKNVNISWNCQRISVAVFSCKRCERRERQVI